MVLVGVACCMMVFPLQALGTGQGVQARIMAPLSLNELGALQDVSSLGPQLVTLPFGRVPRSW